LYDNTKIAVKEITGDGERTPTEAFSGSQSHYLLAAKLGSYARRAFMMPVPRAANWEELTARLLEQCRGRREQKVRGHRAIAERQARDREKLLASPPSKPAGNAPSSPVRKRWCGTKPSANWCRWNTGIVRRWQRHTGGKRSSPAAVT